LGAIKYSSLLFLLAGGAAIFGLAWRFIYNKTFYDAAHIELKSSETKTTRLVKFMQIAFYWLYILLTGLFLVSTMLAGYVHLHRIEAISVKKDVAGTPEASSARMPIVETKKDDGQPKGLNKDRIIQ
jgi:hypothetical protein